MDIQLQSVNFNIKEDLKLFINKKVGKIINFNNKIISTNVYLKLDNSNDKENKVVEIKLNVPGNDLIVKKKSKSFELATDLCVNALIKSLEKLKSKNKPK